MAKSGVPTVAFRHLAILGIAVLASSQIYALPVIGIDYGEEFFKVALVSHGKPFEILLNGSSQRKTPSAVSFSETERRFGAEALSRLAKDPASSFLFTASLLGSSAESVSSSMEGNTTRNPHGFDSEFYPFAYVVDEKRGSIRMKIREGLDMTPEEVTANLFAFIRDMVVDAAGLPPVVSKPPLPPLPDGTDFPLPKELVKAAPSISCVITVPCSSTQRQRQALVDAADLGGLHVLALVSSTSAAALHHAMDLDLLIRDEKASGNPAEERKTTTKSKKTAEKKYRTQHTLFYDVGSKSVEASVVKYSMVKPTPKSAEVLHVEQLSCRSNIGVGGHKVDILLAKEMTRRFEAKHGLTVMDKPKALKKVLKQSNRVKHILSANKTTDLNVESLIGNKDLRETVTRQELEELITKADLLESLSEPIEIAIKEAKVSIPTVDGTDGDLPQLDTVEIVGGGWRIPMLQTKLNTMIHPLQMGQRVNGDDAMAMGAAFISANHSAAFRVKKVLLSNVSPADYKVTVTLVDSDEESRRDFVLFSRTSYFGGKATISVPEVKHDMIVELYEDQTLLSTFTVAGVKDISPPFLFEGSAQVDLTFKVETTGIIVLESAAAKSKNIPEEPSQETSEVPVAEQTGSPDVQQEPAASEKQDGPSDALHGEADNAGDVPEVEIDGNEKQAEAPEASATSEPNATKKKKPQAIKVPDKSPTESFVKLNVTEALNNPLPMDAKDKFQALTNLHDLDQIDREAKSLAHSRNVLETYIYSARDKVNSALDAFENLTELKDKSDQARASEASTLTDQSSLIVVSQPEERAAVLEIFEQTEEWLYGGDGSNNVTVVKERYADLSNKFEPITERAKELVARPQLTALAAKTLNDAESKLADYVENRPWIPAEKFDAARNATQEFSSWWSERVTKQESLADHEFPAITKNDVKQAVKKVIMAVRQLERIPKPTPPPPATAEPTADSSTTTQTPTGTPNESVEEPSKTETPPPTEQADDTTTTTVPPVQSSETGAEKPEDQPAPPVDEL